MLDKTFWKKYSREYAYLKKMMKTHLDNDINRMILEKIHCDFEVIHGNATIPCHKILHHAFSEDRLQDYVMPCDITYANLKEYLQKADFECHDDIKACSGLGLYLSNIYQKELYVDVEINIGGKTIKAHKCVLAARSDYFHAMFNGSWLESETSQINIMGISESSGRQIMLYIYSGLFDLEDYNISEVLHAAEMYSLRGLKSIVLFDIHANYCHFFLKKCDGCLSGAAKSLELSEYYDLDYLKDSILAWSLRNFRYFWLNKNALSFSSKLVRECIDDIKGKLSISTCFESASCCDYALNVTFAYNQTMCSLIHEIQSALISWLSCNIVPLVNSLYSYAYINAGFDWDCIFNIINQAVEEMNPEEACVAYEMIKCRTFDHSLIVDANNDGAKLIEMISLMSDCLKRYCSRFPLIFRKKRFSKISKSIKSSIEDDAGFISFEIDKTKRKETSVDSSSKKKINYLTHGTKIKPQKGQNFTTKHHKKRMNYDASYELPELRNNDQTDENSFSAKSNDSNLSSSSSSYQLDNFFHPNSNMVLNNYKCQPDNHSFHNGATSSIVTVNQNVYNCHSESSFLSIDEIMTEAIMFPCDTLIRIYDTFFFYPTIY